MDKIVRALMWAHYIYLLLLPTLAVVAAMAMFPGTDFPQTILIVGFPCVLMYTLFLANGYALPGSLPVALVVVLAVPLQIGLSVFLFGGRSLWLFFAESGAIEINSFVLGTLSTAFLARRQELPFKIFIFLLLLVLALFGGGLAAYLALVFYGYGGLSAWLVLFVTSFAVASWEYAKVYQKTIEATRKKPGATEEIVMKFESRFIARLLGIRQDVPLISPLRHRAQKSQMNAPVLVFGFTAMFLPLIVSMILKIAGW